MQLSSVVVCGFTPLTREKIIMQREQVVTLCVIFFLEKQRDSFSPVFHWKCSHRVGSWGFQFSRLRRLYLRRKV